MAAEPPSGGGPGAGGEGSRDRHRWSESKVYTRKSHNKTRKPPATSNPHPPPSDLNSTRPASDDDASSLNLPPAHRSSHPSRLHPLNGQMRSVSISLASRSRLEVRELRRRLTSELEQVRALSRKLEAHELQLAGYTRSQLSVSDPITPAAAKRAPLNSEIAPLRRQLSVSVAGENSLSEAVEKEKRTPKANKNYPNSDFVLGKEKLPQPFSHKKPKSKGGKKHSEMGDTEFRAAGQIAEEKMYTQAFKSCGALLAKLMKHKYGWVFNKPVDVKVLGLHDYYTIIKRPMDLGTVKSQLNKNWYKNPGEFAEDVRLTFRNALTYNAKGQDVYAMAEELSKMFEERWPAIEAEYTYVSHSPPPAKKRSPLDLRALERSDSTAHPPEADEMPKPINLPSHSGKVYALKKPKAKDLNKRDMTFDEKQKLSSNLQNLPPEKLDNIVQIIKKRNSTMSQHDDEIEVDIDSVDVETLWELDRFVTNYKKSLSKNKRKAELAILARAQVERKSEERILEPVDAEEPKERNTVVEEKEVASSSPVGGEKVEGNASRSSSSSSSSSDSGSSSSDSDSESSSTNGSDAAHSPRT